VSTSASELAHIASVLIGLQIENKLGGQK